MKKNDIIELDIIDLNNLGCGVAKISGGADDGMVVFVQGAVSGDKVRAKVIKVNRSFAVARLERILVPSAYRSETEFCLAPNSCGGCIYRNITYGHEKELKRAYVESVFRKAGLPDVKIGEVRSTGEASHYRNKAQYPVAHSKNGAYCGFYAQKSHDVIRTDACSLQPALFSDICQKVCALADKYGISVYDEESGKGLLRHIYIREAKATGEVMVCLVINGETLPCADEIVREMTDSFSEIVSVMLNINKKNSNVILGERFECLFGTPYIEDELLGVRFRISAGSFYQVNHDGAQLLYSIAASEAQLGESDTVLDLYCGAGTIGLTMSKFVKEVIGIEIVDEAIACAKENAALNGIKNAAFYCGDASDTEHFLSLAEKERGGAIDADVAIIDPPRKGTTRELIEFIAKRGIARVVYVSCNPDTLARDCKIFAELGYSIGEVTPVDMFPRTGHVESVVCLTR